jgi:hypothetical protein
VQKREEIARICAFFFCGNFSSRFHALLRARERKSPKKARAPVSVFNSVGNSAITKIKNFRFLMLQIFII